MKLNPESTINMHSGGATSLPKSDPKDSREAAGHAPSSVSVHTNLQAQERTCTSHVRLELVFLEDELVVHILNVGQIEIWFRDQE